MPAAATTNRARVFVNGPASWDLLVDLDQLPPPTPHMVLANRYRYGLGGTSAGKALGLARLGVPTTLRTVLGTDADATLIRNALLHPNLTVLADTIAGPSEHHVNLMAADGGRLSIYLDLPGVVPGTAPEKGMAALADADVAVIDLAASSVPMLATARSAGCEIWCDIHDYDGEDAFHRPFIEAADVLVVSADRLPDPGAFLHRVVAGGAALAVCTDGARGAKALSAVDGNLAVPAVAVARVLDTNGAGDAFVAGLLAARLAGRPLLEGLRRGAAAGALAVQSHELVAPQMTITTVRNLAHPS